MTNRIDRLEALHLVKRLKDPNDRRGILVSLTKEGLKRIDTVVAAHMAVEEEMLTGLSSQDRKKLAELLGRLLHTLDPPKGK